MTKKKGGAKTMTLEQIIKKEKAHRQEDGIFGIKACKACITMDWVNYGKSLYVLLEQYVKRYNEDIFFNGAMVLACWELINNK